MFCSHCGSKQTERAKFCGGCGKALIFSKENLVKIRSAPTSSNVRLVNLILDRIISTLSFGLIASLGVFFPKLESFFLILGALWFFLLYDIVFESLLQKTPAKFITKTKVVTTKGEKPKIPQIIGRTLARWVPFEPFSFLSSEIGWHDRWSGTLVVPSKYTKEEVTNINIEKFKEKSVASKILFILVITLVSLMVIGVLASIVLASLNSARMKSRDARRITDIARVRLALEQYFNTNGGSYPSNLYLLVPDFLPSVPKDPANNNAYAYSSCSNSYHLGASLEDKNHPALLKDADINSACPVDVVNGGDSQKCVFSDAGSYCYDMTSDN